MAVADQVKKIIVEQLGVDEDEVTPDAIAEVVSRWTGVPVTRMLEGEREKLMHMEERLAHRVIGQLDAVRAVSNAVRRNRAGLGDPGNDLGPEASRGVRLVHDGELAAGPVHRVDDGGGVERVQPRGLEHGDRDGPRGRGGRVRPPRERPRQRGLQVGARGR